MLVIPEMPLLTVTQNPGWSESQVGDCEEDHWHFEYMGASEPLL